MKKLAVIMLSVIIALIISIGEVYAKSYRVRGYTKKSGTYVMLHRKTYSDKSKFNNYSSKGNFNPYTGKKGTKDPFKK